MGDWLSSVAFGFEMCGFACFLLSAVIWSITLHRAKQAGILDYSMFTLHPVFLLCAGFAAVMLFMSVRYFRAGNMTGFRMSIGAGVIFLSILVWNTGFVTKTGLYLTGSRRIPLAAKLENGLILLIPELFDFRAANPIPYENTPENRKKFAALLEEKTP